MRESIRGRAAKTTWPSSKVSTVINIRSACSVKPDHVRPCINKPAATANNTRSVRSPRRTHRPGNTSHRAASRESQTEGGLRRVKKKFISERSLSPVFGKEMDRKVRGAKEGIRGETILSFDRVKKIASLTRRISRPVASSN